MAEKNYSLDIELSKRDGIYEIGETVEFYPSITVDNEAISSGEIKWTMFRNLQIKVSEGTLKLGEPEACVKVTFEEPSVYQCKATYMTEDGNEISSMTGVAVCPEMIHPSWNIPSDFDEFWERKKALLAEIPMRFELNKLEEEDLNAYDLKIDCVDNVPVSGILVTPENSANGKCPAIITLHGAGVRSADYNTAKQFAEKGFIALDINAHGLDNFKDPDFYLQIDENDLPDYRVRGFCGETPDNIYFINMFLRVKRAIEFITERPEWDGENLLLHGASQGAFQTFAGAYLDNRVTAIACGVPAGSNIADGGWPFMEIRLSLLNDQEREAMRKNAPYVDNFSFTSKLKIPIAMTIGFIDEACRPDGVYAVYNAYKGPKKIWHGPKMPHSQNLEIWQKCVDELMSQRK